MGIYSPSGGYAGLAHWMALDPENEPLVYRKFDKLGAYNLLYMQSELLELEFQIKDLDQHIFRGLDINPKEAAMGWEVSWSTPRGSTTDQRC
ncbi:hypothetical protein MKZ38_000270 [Zalerion maritima]|uniref:DUF6594 domain-containing protein n=1 Tax=Zalerion maritima TaxID=339359 RepID=A0AAD5RRQ9_9PEZI|nr:hypothetical protein MKZ38_000270 [Zalerion maritima]